MDVFIRWLFMSEIAGSKCEFMASRSYRFVFLPTMWERARFPIARDTKRAAPEEPASQDCAHVPPSRTLSSQLDPRLPLSHDPQPSVGPRAHL